MQSLSEKIRATEPIAGAHDAYKAGFVDGRMAAATLAEQWEREQAEHIVVWTEQIDTLQRRLSELLTELAEAKQAHAQT